ncbi:MULTISPECIES: flagellar basal-body MS-ring/collar protein FliF [Rahnella]|jgi:flagellar M-ring protein FliF|uniref:Flagellar M-ring protein n=1 Tax=Rahnella contaminans TaxID=2703882 RepID=A0A6M2AZN5_9GAMM|nr:MULTISPECIES: flagellar basal-body MS-ring/collar protein FliF [Rahnella]MBU9822024.1 flagellar M-ring protein FliF [Rahnella sp. BCC 1045]MCS3423029.1 flagellar M-ring protein FliF [Rahnella sp. BIGb0603]MDF1896437.1 flagellar basal-body MS-ring/collar protein FliF [Rahnella contaminans]NGX86446.1 flagellar basal body M-ring protein FliF [Rahnella contaminans]
MSSAIAGAETSPNGLTALLNRLRANPKIPIAIAAAAALAIVVVMMLWAKQPTYKVLFSNLGDQDGGAIVTQLTQMNIPYQFSENGAALLIPADKVYETRLKLASAGLPKGGAVGFELMDQEKFGISQFSEQINYQRALEGELSRTIETLGPVGSARVHLAIPKPSLFVREQKNPSASVTLNLQPGRALDDGQINAIVYMVSSSVSGLPPANVTVVDQSGHLLTQSDNNGRDLNASQLKYANEVEGRLQRRIESILQPVVGNGNVHAQITAQIDYASREQTDENYQPNGTPEKAAVRSRQLSTSDQIGGTAVGGVPGALSNQPAPAATAPVTNPPAANNANGAQNQAGNNAQNNAQNNTANRSTVPSNSRRDETTNYEVDRTITHTQHSAGAVQRLSAAVVVNYQVGTDGKAKPLTDEQLKKIDDLVREAMGFSQERGDTLNVVNTPFNEAADDSGELPFWKQQAFFDQLLNAGRWLLVLIVAWLLWRKMVRPMLRKQQAEKDAAAAAAIAAAMPQPEGSKPVKLSNDELEKRKRSQQRVSVEVQTQRVQELADKDPRIVALVIRQWMSTEQS